MLMRLFRRAEPKVEKRASSGYTGQVMALREAFIAGRSGLGELTATVQACVSLWEGALSSADVEGTDLLTRRVLAMTARSLALKGECVWLIRDEGLIACSDWDLKTRFGRPTAYRVSISEAGGGSTETALAGEILHFRIASDTGAPWTGQAPLRRAALSAELLQAVEAALAEAYQNMPFGSQVIPFPEAGETDLEALAASFRGRRGRVLLRESVSVAAAGGPMPAADWKPTDTTPDLGKALPVEALEAARHAICAVFGVLPALLDKATTGPLVREAQRHAATWMLQPIAMSIAEECSEKLLLPVTLDVLRPLQAFDAGGRARAMAGYVEALARAKEAGLSPGEVAQALHLVDWE